MKYPITLLVFATAILLVGVGICMHADWKYNNKMYYHTPDSTSYEFEEVFAERKLGDALEFWAVVAGVAGGVWFAIVKISRDRKRSKTE